MSSEITKETPKMRTIYKTGPVCFIVGNLLVLTSALTCVSLIVMTSLKPNMAFLEKVSLFLVPALLVGIALCVGGFIMQNKYNQAFQEELQKAGGELVKAFEEKGLLTRDDFFFESEPTRAANE